MKKGVKNKMEHQYYQVFYDDNENILPGLKEVADLIYEKIINGFKR